MTDFWERFGHLIERGTGCWLWQGQKKPGGYGYIDLYESGDGTRRRVYAHRAVMGFPEAVVRHRCNNPSCVRSDHLTVGTHADNMNDMVLSGRSRSRIDPAHVPAIRACAEAGVSTSFLAGLAGASPTSMRRAISGSTFRALPSAVASRRHGEAHTVAKLTNNSIRQIRAAFAEGEKQTSIARRFDVTPQAINQIVHRKAWRHIQ